MPQTSYKKITQALNYFASQKPSKSINKLKAIKLMWIADRYHLRKYGRPITWDSYEAMPLGPVGSTTKDIAEMSAFLDEGSIEYASQFIRPLNKYSFESKEKVDASVFSDSDIEALRFAYDNFNNWNKYKLKDFTHLYPEWAKYKELLDSGATTKIGMHYDDFFRNPNSQNGSDIFADSAEALEVSKELFAQAKALLDARVEL